MSDTLKEAIEKHASTGKLPGHPGEGAQLRAQAKLRAQDLNKAAMDAGRELTAEEMTEYNKCVGFVQAVNAHHERLAYGKDSSAHGIPGIPRVPGVPGSGNRVKREPRQRDEPIFNSGWNGSFNDGASDESMEFLASWMRGREALASNSPLNVNQSPISPGLAASIRTDVNNPIRTYLANDAFALAGSTIYLTEDVVPLVKPIIGAGADPELFLEGASATDSHPFQADSFTFGGTKYSRLVKVSELALMNVEMDLPGEILAELGASVVNGFTKTITTALMAALHGNPDCFVSDGIDHYDTMLSLTLAPPMRFQDPNNKFMLSRADLKRIKNVRSTQNEPLFDPESGTILGFGFVINDNLDRVVFGSWQAGAFVRKSPFILQRLIELYSAQGQTGFKATQFLDQKFLASVATVDVQPLYYANLETAGS